MKYLILIISLLFTFPIFAADQLLCPGDNIFIGQYNKDLGSNNLATFSVFSIIDKNKKEILVPVNEDMTVIFSFNQCQVVLIKESN